MLYYTVHRNFVTRANRCLLKYFSFEIRANATTALTSGDLASALCAFGRLFWIYFIWSHLHFVKHLCHTVQAHVFLIVRLLEEEQSTKDENANQAEREKKRRVDSERKKESEKEENREKEREREEKSHGGQ